MVACICQLLEQAYVAGLNEDLWHRRYGHLGNDRSEIEGVEK